MNTIAIGTQVYEVRKLSARALLDCIRAAETFRPLLEAPDFPPSELSGALAEHGALAAACLYQNGTPVFASPAEALQSLSVNDLCRIYDCYAGTSGTVQQEAGINAGFPAAEAASSSRCQDGAAGASVSPPPQDRQKGCAVRDTV